MERNNDYILATQEVGRDITKLAFKIHRILSGDFEFRQEMTLSSPFFPQINLIKVYGLVAAFVTLLILRGNWSCG
jgi:hypothetical protein